MKVFKLTPQNPNYSGCAFIAAKSKKEAETLYKQANVFNSILFDEASCKVTLSNEPNYKGKDIILSDNIALITMYPMVVPIENIEKELESFLNGFGKQ